MRFAMVDGTKTEAAKDLIGFCIGCGQTMIAKCGPVKVNHWAHKSECECDHWWENETEWHRAWKNHFPTDCQECRQQADNGEWHIADVRTKQDHFLEFQHSYLKPEERLARNNFYGDKLVWIVDGLKRKNDLLRFDALLKSSKPIHKNIQLIQLSPLLEECPIVSEWSECNGPVFFDFGIDLPLWCLFPKSPKAAHYIGPFSRQIFLDLHNGGLTQNGQSFSGLMKILNDTILAYENPQQQNNSQPSQTIIQRQTMIHRSPSQRYFFPLRHSPRRRRWL